MRPITQRLPARGFTLIELMVAITISMLLLMGVVALFISSRASYETTERLSRIQENGRYALDQLANDIRAAGYQGCARAIPGSARASDFAITTLNTPTDLRWNFAQTSRGFQGLGGGAWAPPLDVSTLGFSPSVPSANGDVLVLRTPKRDARGMQLTTAQADPTAPLTVGDVTPAPFQVNDIAMVSDCTARAWFQVTGYAGGQISHGTGAVSEGPGNAQDTLLHRFTAGAEVVPVVTMIYYLAPSSADPSRMSLWRKNGLAAVSDELAEGIERFEVRYGIDNAGADGRVDTYVDANLVTDWDRVYSMQIALLSRSPDAYGTDIDSQTYTLMSGAPAITAGPMNDRNQRKVFTTIVAMRNQVID